MENIQDNNESIPDKSCNELEKILMDCINLDKKCDDLIDDKILKKCFNNSKKE